MAHKLLSHVFVDNGSNLYDLVKGMIQFLSIELEDITMPNSPYSMMEFEKIVGVAKLLFNPSYRVLLHIVSSDEETDY